MGFGFPAAIGAKIGNRDKEVVCFTGDGGFQMNIQEMATAVVQEAPVIICLFNNYYLGMVRQMQQLFYGKRYEEKENLSGELQGTECILSAVHTGFYCIGKELRRTRDPCGKRGGHPGGT